MSAASSITTSSGSFHFSPPTQPANLSPLHSPISPIESSRPSSSSPPLSASTSPSLFAQEQIKQLEHDLPTPLFRQQTSSRPPLNGRAPSYASNGTAPVSTTDLDASALERQRRVSYAGQSIAHSDVLGGDSIWGGASRTVRASSEDQQLLSRAQAGTGALSLPTDSFENAALFREHERRSLESSASVRLANASAGAQSYLTSPTASAQFLQQQQQQQPPQQQVTFASSFSQKSVGSSPPLSATSDLSGPRPIVAPQSPPDSDGSEQKQSASLHLGDLDVWMDEAYVRECCARMGWDGVVGIKMIRGASPASGYCFLTFPSPAHAAQVLAKFSTAPPTLMPRSNKTFKLNWGTGLPGVQPRWDGEYSVFVGDLGRDVTESELVNLFTPLFPSTKSAKIMTDPTTLLSRGYGFMRFSDEADMNRALLLGQNAGSGLSLHGRTIRISLASGPGSTGERERTRTRSGEGLTIQTAGGYSPYQDSMTSPTSGYSEFLSPTSFSSPFSGSTPMSPASQHFAQGPLSPPMGGGRGPLSPNLGSSYSGGHGGHSSAAPHTTDPNNTTVFVGGLPACISEETLKSFFHHFGEITYCKIPTGKGCGFVQFVRRADAELAIAKMNDFPIHGKSRIRLSWGRSQGDKQVEHVRKLAVALNVPFDSVWKMVQGQDNSTIKQIATAVGGPPVLSGRFENLGVGRMELGAVASAAGLTEAEVMDLVGGKNNGAQQESGHPGSGHSSVAGRSDSDFFGRSSMHSSAATSPMEGASNGGPYSRVSPSTFSAFTSTPTPSAQNHLPMSPPPSAGYTYTQMQHQQQQLPSPLAQSGYGHPSPYTSIRPESYLVQAPPSPYERVDFAEGGVPHGSRGRPGDRYQPQQQQQQQHHQHQPYQAYPAPPRYNTNNTNNHSGYGGQYDQHLSYEQQQLERMQLASMEESFANLGFSSAPRTQGGFNATAGEFLPSNMSPAPGGRFTSPVIGDDRHGGAASWSAWNSTAARDVQA